MNSILRECLSYVEHFIIPSMAILMPWWLVIKFFRVIAQVPFLYRDMAEDAAQGAIALGLLEKSPHWIRNYKVGLMVDYADVFLLLIGRNSYWRKYVNSNVEQAVQSQQIIFTPHYGAGMWLFWLLHKTNTPTAIFINIPKKKFSAENLFGRVRLYVFKRLNVKVISPDNKSELRQALAQKTTIVTLPDLPVTQELVYYQPTTELGNLNVLAFFFDLAEKCDLPVLNIVFSLDINTGVREFNTELYENLTAQEYAQHFATLTVKSIIEQPYLWRIMVVAPQVILHNNNQ